MSDTKANSTVDVICLCGKVCETVLLDTSISVPVDFCHCNICRWTTGCLFYSALPLQEPLKCIEQLIRYNSSDKVSRYFCGTCGDHICHKIHKDNTWHVAAGAVERDLRNEQVLSRRGQQITEHQFVADTGDGGLALCFAESTQVSAHFYMQASNKPAVDLLSEGLFPEHEAGLELEERLKAGCHCGGIEFYLSRPNKASKQGSSPWPDLLRAYHTHDSANPEDVKWWLRGSERFLAGTCACRSCRLSHATAITTWGFIPKANLSTKDGSPLDSERGSRQRYASSKGKTREFCSVCGASVFLRIDERPEIIDVSMGLFRAREGARAESWFEWATDRVSFVEDAIDKELVEACESGLKCLAG